MADVPAPSGESPPSRLVYLDWVRGLAVLIMIEAHLLDSWTAAADRGTRTFVSGIFLGGFGAPLFLLLAGVSVSLSAASKFRRLNDSSAAARAVMRRGGEVFILAFLFRAQAWILGWGSPRTLLRVDILNIMGISIVAAAALWGLGRTLRGRTVTFAAATFLVAMLTPVVRAAGGLSALPDPIEAYLRPAANLTNFPLLPSAGFVFGGALLGLIVDAARARSSGLRVHLAIGLAGVLIALAGYGASLGPSPFAKSDFWTSSPSFFFIRLGVLGAAVAVGYLWIARPRGGEKWSPLRELGRSSFFIYWIHIELVYGLISLPLHRALTLPVALVALFLFTLAMLLCAIGKDRVVAWWRTRGA